MWNQRESHNNIPLPVHDTKRKRKQKFEPPHDKTNKMACVPSEDSDQPGHPPSLIRVFAVRMKKVWVLSYPLSAQRRLLSDWADAQADLSLRWAHSHFVGFVMRRLINAYKITKKCTRSTKTSSLFPKRDGHNAKQEKESIRTMNNAMLFYLKCLVVKTNLPHKIRITPGRNTATERSEAETIRGVKVLLKYFYEYCRQIFTLGLDGCNAWYKTHKKVRLA